MGLVSESKLRNIAEEINLIDVDDIGFHVGFLSVLTAPHIGPPAALYAGHSLPFF